jgi:zinc protease
MRTIPTALLVVLFAAVWGAEQTPSQVIADPTIIWGKLDNGIHYAIAPANDLRINVRVVVASGSMHESATERGYAHFLEHMVFNGSKRYPAGTLEAALAQIGVRIGLHSNANTGMESTTYWMTPVEATPAHATAALTILADLVGGATIPRDQVERERGVVLAEMRDADHPAQQRARLLRLLSMRGPGMEDREPIGTLEAISAATDAGLRAWRDAWYRPERTLCVVTGHINRGGMTSDQVAAIIREQFGPIKAFAPARATPALPAITPTADPIVRTLTSPAVVDDEIMIAWTRDDPDIGDGFQPRCRQLLEEIAARAVVVRLDLMALKPESNLTNVSRNGMYIDRRYCSGLTIRAPHGKAADAIKTAAEEIGRVLKIGPRTVDLEQVRSSWRTDLKRSAETAQYRTFEEIAALATDAFVHQRICSGPAEATPVFLPVLEKADIAGVRKAFAAQWSASRIVVVVQSPSAIEEKNILTAWKAGISAQPTADDGAAMAVWAYDDRPAAVSPTLRRETPGKDAVLLEYANGVACGAMRNQGQLEQAEIRMFMYVPVGMRTSERQFAFMASLFAGVGKHTLEEMTTALAGRGIRNFNFQWVDDGFEMVAGGEPRDVEVAMQVIRAFLTDRAKGRGDEVSRSRYRSQIQNANRDLDNFAYNTLRELIGDPIFLSDVSVTDRPLPPEASAWYEDVMANAPLGISVVGGIDLAAMENLLACYFGSLPQRRMMREIKDLAAVMADGKPFPPGGTHHAKIDRPSARSVLQIAWPTEDYLDQRRDSALNLLATIMQERMTKRIRHDLGLTYSPSVGHNGSTTYRGRGFMLARISVASDAQDAALKAMFAEADAIAANGVTAEEVTAHIGDVLQGYRSAVTRNATMGRMFCRYHTSILQLGRFQQGPATYQSLKREDINLVARRYIVHDRAFALIATGNGQPAAK